MAPLSNTVPNSLLMAMDLGPGIDSVETMGACGSDGKYLAAVELNLTTNLEIGLALLNIL